MYSNILVALENTRTDASLIPHIARLATLLKSRLLLIHVADGWAARNFDHLKLTESEEMMNDRQYLERIASELRTQGLEVDISLARGEPSKQILLTAEREGCDLIAMTTHGHRFLGDLIHGSTISEVRHQSRIPLLLVRALP